MTAAFPKLKIGFSFLFFNAMLFMFRDTGLIMGFYAACILHELGHIAALLASHRRIREISLSCFGIKITADPPTAPLKGAAVLIMGPAVNLISCLIAYCTGSFGFFFRFSLAEGIFNLLPFSGLDGGGILDLLTEGSKYEKSLKIAVKTAFIVVGVNFYILFLL